MIRLFIASIVLGSVLVGCGSEQKPVTAPPAPPQTAPTGPAPAPNSKWKPEQLSQSKQGCVTVFVQNYGYDSNFSTSFCSCIYAVIASKWTFEDWQYNFENYIDQMSRDKSIDTCINQSGATKASAVTDHLSRSVR